jgi:hypothetical protein
MVSVEGVRGVRDLDEVRGSLGGVLEGTGEVEGGRGCGEGVGSVIVSASRALTIVSK